MFQTLINTLIFYFLGMRSQISIEFMTGVAVMLFIYVVTIGLYSSYVQTDMIESEISQEICYIVANGVNSAVIGGNGFANNISLPYRIYGHNYNTIIISNSSTVTVDWGSGIRACSIISQNITGKWVYPGKFSASNINDTVYITSVQTDKLTYTEGENVHISGGYFLNDVKVNVVNYNQNSLPGYPRTLPIINNEFSDNWQATQKGLYTVSGVDTVQKTLYGERIIEVI
jgi:hypothetical protein